MVAIRSLATVLTYLIGLCGVIPLLPWLETLPRVILIVGLLSGFWQDHRGSWPLKPWMQNVAIVPVFFFYALQFSRINPIQPVVSVLTIMLAVRLSGEKTVRHSLQIYALSMFCLASSSLFDLSPIFLIYLGLLLFMVAIALVLLTFQSQDQAIKVSKPDLKRILFSGLLMPVMAVPLLLFFFPIMPRTQIPLWHFLSPPSTRTTGYSDSVEPCSQSTLAQSRALAFRAEMPPMAHSGLYWRGTVFNLTDGNKWTRSRQIPTEQIQYTGQTVLQVIYPEPTATRVLVALDRPSSILMQRVTRSQDGVFELFRSPGRRFSYNAKSKSNDTIAQQNPVNRQFYLQLPDHIPPRIKALALETFRSGDDDLARLKSLENYFRNGDYRYSTHDLATGADAVEQFLFKKKQGNCEFFASSFALLLRAAGVPSRLVGGYIGGEYNNLGGYYLVTDDKAHVWVEAFIEGHGWVRTDPSSFAINAGDVWTPRSSRDLKLHIAMALDSFNYVWNKSVVNYDLEQQANIVRHVSLRLQGINPAKMFHGFLFLVAAGLLFAGLLLVVRRASFFCSREQRILGYFLRTMEQKFGITREVERIGLFEIASIADNIHVSDFARIYAGAIYHDRRLTDEEYLGLRRILYLLNAAKTKIP